MQNIVKKVNTAKSWNAFEHEQREIKLDKTRAFLEDVSFFHPRIALPRLIEPAAEEHVSSKFINDEDFYRGLTAIAHRSPATDGSEGELASFNRERSELKKKKHLLKDPLEPLLRARTISYQPNVISNLTIECNSSLQSSTTTLQSATLNLSRLPMKFSSTGTRWNSDSGYGTAVTTPITLFESEEGILRSQRGKDNAVGE
jgi:hypothetical protein